MSTVNVKAVGGGTEVRKHYFGELTDLQLQAAKSHSVALPQVLDCAQRYKFPVDVIMKEEQKEDEVRVVRIWCAEERRRCQHRLYKSLTELRDAVNRCRPSASSNTALQQRFQAQLVEMWRSYRLCRAFAVLDNQERAHWSNGQACPQSRYDRKRARTGMEETACLYIRLDDAPSMIEVGI